MLIILKALYGLSIKMKAIRNYKVSANGKIMFEKV